MNRHSTVSSTGAATSTKRMRQLGMWSGPADRYVQYMQASAAHIRIQRCTCALSAQLPPSTSNAAGTAKARMRATAPQPLRVYKYAQYLYTGITGWHTCLLAIFGLLKGLKLNTTNTR